MARADIENAHILSKISGIQVKVYDGSAWIDLINPTGSSFPGQSRVKAYQWNYSHGAQGSAGKWTATITFLNTPVFRAANESLDPTDTSIFNPSGVPLLGSYHPLQIWVGKYDDTSPVPVAGADAMVFSGFVGPDSIEPEEGIEGNDVVVARVVGVMQPYFADYIDKIDRGRVYTDCYVSGIWNATTTFAVGEVCTLDGVAYECILESTNNQPPNATYWTVFSGTNNVLNQILLDYGYDADIVIDPSPTGQDTLTFYCSRYELGDISVGDAIQRPISAIGFVLMEKYNATQGNFVPTVVDPDRDNTTADIDLEGNENTIRYNYSEANVRTFVRVVFYNTGSDPLAPASPGYVDAENDAARLIYGSPGAGGVKLHKRMRIVENDLSWIDSPVEAQREANAAANDAGTPATAVSAVIPWLALDIEGGDIVRIVSPSKTMDIGITSIVHNVGDGDMYGHTVIQGTLGRRVGNYGYWFERSRTDNDWRQERYIELLYGPLPKSPTNVVAKPVWGKDTAGAPAPWVDVSWFGAKDGRTRTHIIRYRTLEYRDRGVASGGSTTTLTDCYKDWTVNTYRNGGYCYLTGDNGPTVAGEYWATVDRCEIVSRLGTDNLRRIKTNTGTVLTFETALTLAPENMEAYEIYWATGDWHEVTIGNQQFVQLPGLPEGNDYMIEVAAVPTVTGT